MTQASPHDSPRGSWWMTLLIAFALLGTVVVPSWGQDPKEKAEGTPKAEADEKAKAEPEAAPKENAPVIPDRWEDPRAAEALANTFEINALPLSPDVRRAVIDMSEGRGRYNASAVDTYVKGLAAELTKKANIKALTDLGGNSDKAKEIEEAATDLMKPLSPTLTAGNQRFRQEYVAKMIEVFKPIWKGNLHSRTMAMIVLSRTGDPQTLPVFTDQLNDPNQLAIVKLLAAVGITNAARNGRATLGGQDSVNAARALVGFLERERDTFWPAQFRALEALGSLRIATRYPQNARAEFADTAASFLVDPNAPPTVRVWAAWALGMMQIPGAVQGYNFPLLAYLSGQTAAELGTKISLTPDDKLNNRALRLTDLLVQLNLAFAGESDIRSSGFIHASHQAAAPAMSYMNDVHQRVRAVTKASIDLSNAVGVQIPDRRKTLIEAVEDLKSFLAKPPQGGFSLYIGGPDLSKLSPSVSGSNDEQP